MLGEPESKGQTIENANVFLGNSGNTKSPYPATVYPRSRELTDWVATP